MAEKKEIKRYTSAELQKLEAKKEEQRKAKKKEPAPVNKTDAAKPAANRQPKQSAHLPDEHKIIDADNKK